MFERGWNGTPDASRGTARFGAEGGGTACGGGGGISWGGWWVEGVPIPPPGYPFPGREGSFDELDIETTEAAVCGVDKTTGLNDGFLVKARGVVEGSGHATTEKAEPLEMGDVVVRRATKAVDAVDEEGNPAEQEKEKEGELAATGEVVQVLAS